MIKMLHTILSPKATMAVMMAVLLLVLPLSASAAPTSALAVPFTGTATAADGTVQSIAGTFNITSFATQNGQLVAIGTANFLSNGVQQVVRTTAAVTAATGTCTVLDLTLGPIHLNLLGLHVDTNEIHISITADPAGGLLGQLLCAVANLLNGGLTGGLLNQLTTLLNQILGALG